MFILAISSFFLINILIKFKVGTYINLMLPFTIFWTICILLSKYTNSELFIVSNNIYNKMYIFIFITLISFLLVTKPIKKFEVYKPARVYKTNIFLIIIKLVLLFILLYYLIKYNIAKEGLPIYKIRLIRFEIGPIFKTGLELLFYNYIISSLVELFGLLSIIRVFSGQKINIDLILSILLLTLYSLIGNGRFGLFNALIFIIMTLFFSNKLFQKKKFEINITKIKNIFLYGLIIIFLIFIIVQIGSNRMISEQTGILKGLNATFNQAILYFIAPFRAIDNFYFNYIPNWNNFSYGRAFISGLDEFVVQLLSLGNPINGTISSITSEPILVGEGIYFNAFYTVLLNSYLDFGNYGIYIIGFAVGTLSGVITNFSTKRNNIYSFSLIIYTSLITLSTVYRFELQQFKSFFILFSLIILSQYSFKKEGKSEI